MQRWCTDAAERAVEHGQKALRWSSLLLMLSLGRERQVEEEGERERSILSAILSLMLAVCSGEIACYIGNPIKIHWGLVRNERVWFGFGLIRIRACS